MLTENRLVKKSEAPQDFDGLMIFHTEERPTCCFLYFNAEYTQDDIIPIVPNVVICRYK